MGAWFSMLALPSGELERCLFVSPVLDMGLLIEKMMGWADVTPERLEQVRKGIRNRKARETDIYGLYNVNERIRLNFGENYGITITSTYGEGTCVTVRLPQY